MLSGWSGVIEVFYALAISVVSWQCKTGSADVQDSGT